MTPFLAVCLIVIGLFLLTGLCACVVAGRADRQVPQRDEGFLQ